MEKTCENPGCGKKFGPKRNKASGKTEGCKGFQTRRFCSHACSAVARRVLWSDEAMDVLRTLIRYGFTYRECAENMSGRYGLGRITQHQVEAAVRRDREGLHSKREPERVVKVAEPADEPLPEPRMDKPRGQCRYGTCTLPRQPGRDWCAEHIRTLIADKMPHHNASSPVATTSGDGSQLASVF